MSRHYKIINW